MIRALLKAIRAKIDADSGATGVATAISGRYYLGVQVDRTTGGGTTKYPFLVCNIITEAPQAEFPDVYIERVLVQFSVFDNSDGNSPDTCAQVTGKVRALFDGASLDLTADGYTTAACIREGGVGPLRIDGAWQMTTDYMVVFST